MLPYSEAAQTIKRWIKAGATVLQWTEVPEVFAVVRGRSGNVYLIDGEGCVWAGLKSYSEKQHLLPGRVD